MTFQDAEQFCIDNYGTNLASIHSHDEQSEAWNLCTKWNTISNNHCWIGLFDINRQQAFRWMDGSPYIYDMWYWLANEPSGRWNDENCVHLNGWNGNIGTWSGKWNDIACSSTFHFLCNYPKYTFSCPKDYLFCSKENGICQERNIAYGYGTSWNYKSNPDRTSIPCNSDQFGHDAIRGVTKICCYSSC